VGHELKGDVAARLRIARDKGKVASQQDGSIANYLRNFQRLRGNVKSLFPVNRICQLRLGGKPRKEVTESSEPI